MGRKNINKTELSRLSGVQRTMASDIVRGLQQADIEVLEQLTDALGLDLVQVLRDAEGARARGESAIPAA